MQTTTAVYTTNIISNGNFPEGNFYNDATKAGLQYLCDRLASEPLDRTFECYGNFVIAPEDGETLTRFFGNFFTYSHVFSIDTDDPQVIERLTALIRSNQQRADYLEQDEPLAAKHKQHLREVTWIYAKAAHLNATASNGEKLVKVNGNFVKLWDMSLEAMTKFTERYA